MLALAGDVAGLRVLDAGCGPGLYAEELIRAGAHVMGCDESPALVSRALKRTAGAADLRVHDLSEALTWVPDDSRHGLDPAPGSEDLQLERRTRERDEYRASAVMSQLICQGSVSGHVSRFVILLVRPG